MSKYISYALFVAGLILIGMSIFYIFRIISQDLWDDVIFRIISVLAFIGGGVFVGMAQVIRNQNTVIELLRREKHNGAV